MNKFISLYEYYCPFLEKNIVIEHHIVDDVNNKDACSPANICLNSHECHCGKKCKNNLLDMMIELSRT